MAGGNTYGTEGERTDKSNRLPGAKRGRPYRGFKGTGHTAPDVKAYSGAETFANPENLQLFKYPGDSYEIDCQQGYDPFGGVIPEGGGYQGNTQGYLQEELKVPKYEKANASPPPRKGGFNIIIDSD